MHCEYVATATSAYVVYESVFRTRKEAVAFFDDLAKQGIKIRSAQITPVNVGDRLDAYQLHPLTPSTERNKE